MPAPAAVPFGCSIPIPNMPAACKTRRRLLGARRCSSTLRHGTTAPKALKAYDLAWMLHLVGDVHQPLHMANQYGSMFQSPAQGNDAGGNGIPVQYAGYHELHGFWDGAPGDSKNLAKVLKISITAA